MWDFPGGPAATTVLPMQEPGFDPWSGNEIPATKLILATCLWLKILHATTKEIRDAATKKVPEQKDICTQVFTQHSLPQPRHRSNQDDWFRKMQYVYTVITKSEILPFSAKWTDQENIMLSEIRRRMTNTIYHITYMWNLKNTNESIYKTDSQT